MLISYGTIVHNMTNAIERKQIEAARIVTWTTRLVSLDMLSKETDWESLRDRRYKHKMCQFYKMINDLTPTYLMPLVPSTVKTHQRIIYETLKTLGLYLQEHSYIINLFLPSCIREWNEVPLNIRNSTSLSSFKQQLNKNNIKVLVYYSSGNILLQIHILG